MDPRPVRHRLRHPAIDVWSAGTGPTIVLLHGWGLSGRAYRPAMRALAERGYRVVAPCLSVVDGGWTMQRVVRTASDALFAMEAVGATVVGHSFGGALGVRLSLEHPDIARTLVLVDSFVVSPGARSLVRIALPGPHWRVGMGGSTALALAASAVREGGMRSLARQARWVLRSSLEGDLAQVRERGIPAAVLWAERDTLLPLDLGRRTADALGVPLEVVPRRPDDWPLQREPDHDWPTRAPAFFAARIDAAAGALDHAAAR